VDALLSGGLARWREFKSLSAHMSIGGPLWAIKGWEEVLTDVTVTIDTRVERTTFEPFTDPNLRTIFEVDAERVTIETTDGEQVRELRDARAGFKGFVRTTPWERTHLGYFLGYAFGTISPHQVFYFDTDGLQRRMDYVTEILDSTLVAHYSSRHRSFGGILIPTRRRVFRRNPDNTSNLNMPSITIDIHDVMLQRGHRSHRSNRHEHRPGSINVPWPFQVRRLSVPLPLLYDRAIECFEELVLSADLARFGRRPAHRPRGRRYRPNSQFERTPAAKRNDQLNATKLEPRPPLQSVAWQHSP